MQFTLTLSHKKKAKLSIQTNNLETAQNTNASEHLINGNANH